MSAHVSRRFRVAGGEVARCSGPHLHRDAECCGTAEPKGPSRVDAAARVEAVLSGTFVPKNGRALLRSPVDALRRVAVTVNVEPSGGRSQPTSKPVFVLILPATKA